VGGGILVDLRPWEGDGDPPMGISGCPPLDGTHILGPASQGRAEKLIAMGYTSPTLLMVPWEGGSSTQGHAQKLIVMGYTSPTLLMVPWGGGLHPKDVLRSS